MGFRYRKSINLGGGFRINLSKSGIGYSWGVKGYRITKTADGKTRRTISIPGTGISYSEEVGKKGKKASTKEEKQANLNSSYHDIREVKSAEITALKSDTYNRLFHQIKKRKIIVYGVAVVAVLLISVPPLCLTLLMIDWILSRFLKIPLIYEFDEYQHEKWDELSAAWKKVASSKDLQEITLNAKANNPRINAGISNVIDSKSMSAGGKLPWFLKTNVKPVVFTLQKSKMAILPDGIMFFDKKIGALDYKDIRFNLSAVGFLVTGKRPNDSELIRYAWGYSNNDGTRDKRYKNNKQFPIMKYGKFIITSNSGLNIQFLCSNEKAADNLSQVMKKYKML